MKINISHLVILALIAAVIYLFLAKGKKALAAKPTTNSTTNIGGGAGTLQQSTVQGSGNTRPPILATPTPVVNPRTRYIVDRRGTSFVRTGGSGIVMAK